MKKRFSLIIGLLLAALILTACGGANTSQLGTPIPTLPYATPPALNLAEIVTPVPEACQAYAVDLIGAWVAAGSPEVDPFPFTDVQGNNCAGTFAVDIQLLFSEANVWYSGVASCVTCHGPDVAASWAQLDLSTYQGILAGSRRTSAEATGTNILGDGDWQKAILNTQLSTGRMPPGRPAELDPRGPVVIAGIKQ